MFGEKILEYWDDIMNDMKDMIAIPSVATPMDGKFPFGENCANAVDFAMELMQKYGLKSKNIDYYACHAEIGEGEENAVVMAHLDVVPFGEGWTSPANEMTVRDGYIYGRGIADDKGPAIIALHCLRALNDAGVIGKRKLRVVLGSGEEVGMGDMPYYFEREQEATFGFTPDSAYGICNGEKGNVRFTVCHENNSNIVKNFTAGTVVNAVPYKANCTLACSQSEVDYLKEAIYKSNENFILTETETGCEILAQGIAAHASTPELGKNAASLLIDLLYSVFGERIGSVLSFAQKNIGLTYDGSKFGLACADEVSGALTFNLGIVKVDEQNASFCIDIRFPVTKKAENLLEIVEKTVAETELTLKNLSSTDPLYIPKEHMLVDLLSNSYEEFMGEKPNIFCMGGGTYAKEMGGNGLAFGPAFDEDDTHIHDKDERIKEEELKLHAKICLEAMYQMFIY